MGSGRLRLSRSVFLDRVASVEYTIVSLYGRRAVCAAFAACSAVPKANYNTFAQIGSPRTPPEEKDRCRNARFSPTYAAVIRSMDSANA
jgi:hypothetical protein